MRPTIDAMTCDVEVAFYGPLRPIAGTHLLTLSLGPASTVGHLLSIILARLPALRPELVDASEQPLPYVHLIVNGRDYPYLRNRLDTPLQPGDRVDIFPATAGGGGTVQAHVQAAPLVTSS